MHITVTRWGFEQGKGEVRADDAQTKGKSLLVICL